MSVPMDLLLHLQLRWQTLPARLLWLQMQFLLAQGCLQMGTVEQHQTACHLVLTSVQTDLPWHLHLHRLLCTTTKEKLSVVPMLHTPTPRSTVLFGVAFNSSATETSVLSSL